MAMAMEENQTDGAEPKDEERVRLIPAVVKVNDVTGAALDIIQREDLPYLPVVAEDTGKLVGVVMRKGLERGCWAMGHKPDRCPMANHLKTGVEFWFEDEPLDARVLRKANDEPVVIVDHELKPVGIIRGE